MDSVTKFVRGLPFRFGGEEHSGWLPPGAAKPLPTPIRDVLLDVTIVRSGESGGYLLCFISQDGEIAGDDWFPSQAEAERAAPAQFGVQADQWQLPDLDQPAIG